MAPPLKQQKPVIKPVAEREVTVGRGEWALPATFSTPLAGPVRAGVVFVHGSGPQDRDAAVTERLPAFVAKVDELWTVLMRAGGIDRTELDRRLDAIKKDVQTTAAVVWDRQQRPFGETHAETGTATNPQRFPGQVADAATASTTTISATTTRPSGGISRPTPSGSPAGSTRTGMWAGIRSMRSIRMGWKNSSSVLA